MKKLLLITLSCLALYSCKKGESQPEKEVETEFSKAKYDVTFSIADFSQTVGTMSTKATLAVGDTLKNYADNLVYRVYNSGGVLINTISQQSTASEFGTISDKLPTGTYNIVMIANKGGVNFSTNNVGDIFNFNIVNDLFAKRFPITVTNTAINQQVRLDREVAGLDVVLEDAIPSTASKITVYIQNDANYIYVDGHSYSPVSSRQYDYIMSSTDYGVKNKKFSMFVSNTYIPTSVIIRAFNNSNQLIVEKTVSNVTFVKNKRTTLTGSLFPVTTSPLLGFTVVINPTWSTPSSPIIF